MLPTHKINNKYLKYSTNKPCNSKKQGTSMISQL